MIGTRNNTVVHVRGWHLQRMYAKIGKAHRKALERAKLAETGIIAGAPMGHEARRMAYHAQTGAATMTPAQRRRYNKKLIREMVRLNHSHVIDEAAA